MDYKASAKAVADHIGGRENIVSAAHCATRLRLVIADNSKCNIKELENVEGVKGVFEASGQLQVIFGTGIVNKVYEEFVAYTGITEASKEEVKQAASAKQNPFKRAIKTLGDIFVPIIPAIVASGLLMGLLEGLSKIWPGMATSGTYEILLLFSNAAFTFLPILIAISAARTFGGNMFLGAVIGMIMIHPNLLNAWSVAGMSAAEIPQASVWFGLFNINMVGYQGHVIPVVIAVWLMSAIEKKLHKIVPEIIDLFVTPLVTVLVSGYITLTIIGPVFGAAENIVLDAAERIITLPFGIGGLIVGGLYAITVVAGLHHMYNALEAGLLSTIGINTWMPIATAANVAQGAASLAVAVKSKNRKTKAIALPAALSSYMGITEPAIFGVNIRYMKPFVAACIGGACGGLIAGLFGIGATGYGVTGIFGFLLTTNFIWQYALVIAVSSVVAFLLSWMMYKEEVAEQTTEVATKETAVEAGHTDAVAEEKTLDACEAVEVRPGHILAPLEGETMELSHVSDPTFAQKILGEGAAVLPAIGRVVAPFNGTVETIYDTKHAIGLVSDDGIELLIHVGINTVELNGMHFTPHVASGDKVEAGQVLVSFDLDAIKAAGYSMETPIIVTNTMDYDKIEVVKIGDTKFLETIMVVK